MKNAAGKRKNRYSSEMLKGTRMQFLSSEVFPTILDLSVVTDTRVLYGSKLEAAHQHTHRFLWGQVQMSR